MRAVQIRGIKEIAVSEIEPPLPGSGEVTILLKAAALNHRDVWIWLGQYAGIKYPCQPGSDGAGIIAAVGDGVDPMWKGREVMINPSFGWGASERAQDSAFTILGLPRAGTLAQQITVPLSQVSLKPSHLSWSEAAALPLAGLTAWRALMSRAQVRAGDRVLITGIGGGVALFGLQFAVAQGADVWVTSSSNEKISRAVGLGAKGGANYADADWAATLGKRAGGFDVIMDSAGGPGFEALIDLAAPGGRIVFFGATRGNPPLLPMRKIFWRQLSLLGTTMGSPADWAAMVDFVATRQLKPVISAELPLDRVVEAFGLMERGEQFGKLVVQVG